MQEVMHLH